jgi:hypothetical protein
MKFGILGGSQQQQQRSHEQELMIFSAEESDAGASLPLNTKSTANATTHEGWRRSQGERAQPSHFVLNPKFNVIKTVRLEEGKIH